MNKYLSLLISVFFSACAIEVGNPHPQPTDGKSGIKLNLVATGNLNVDKVNLNLVGVKLIRKDASSQNIAFASSRQIMIAKGQEQTPLNIHQGTTRNTGTFSKVRMYFDKEEFGDVVIAGSSYPLTLGQEASFLDVPIEFGLKLGELTRITLSLAAADVIQEIKDAGGQTTAYQMNSKIGAQAESEQVTEEAKEKRPTYSHFRIAVSKVNKGSEFHMRRLKLLINNNWETGIVDRSVDSGDIFNGVRIGSNTSAIKVGIFSAGITASSNGNSAWKAFDNNENNPDSYESDSEFSVFSGKHKNDEFEYIEMQFNQLIELQGYEFSSDGDSDCPVIYELQGSANGEQWLTIEGSQSSLEACELVNVTW